MLKRKRNDLSLADKYEVVKLLDKNLSQSEIAAQLYCSQSQISRVSTNREKIKEAYHANGNHERKRQRSGKAADVESALSTWFSNAQTQNLPVSTPVLGRKAEELARQLRVDDFKATSGWLSRWKRRNKIIIKHSNDKKVNSTHMKHRNTSETDSADMVDTVLPGFLKDFKPEDIYTADETGLYYSALPEFTYISNSDRYSCVNKGEDSVTLMVCCNMTGTDKRPLLVIGKQEDPPCFQRKVLPVDYKHNAEAWMTHEIFLDWLTVLNNDMQTQGRKILLLVNNCSIHLAAVASTLSNITLKVLPTDNITPLHPCDQGITQNLKVLYRKMTIKLFLWKTEVRSPSATVDGIKKITLLDGVHLAAHAWRDVKPQTIVKCFRKCGFVTPDEDLDSNENETALEIVELPCGVDRQQFEQLLAIDEELQCHGDTREDTTYGIKMETSNDDERTPDTCQDSRTSENTQDTISDEMTNVYSNSTSETSSAHQNHLNEKTSSNDEDYDKDSCDSRKTVTATEALHAIKTLRKFVEIHYYLDKLESLVEKEVKKDLLKELGMAKGQTKITDFFRSVP